MREKISHIKKRLIVGDTKAIGSHLLVFLLPFLLVSFIWFRTSSHSIEQQVTLNAKNQLLQLKYSLENNFLQLDNITQNIPYDYHLSLNNMEHPYYSKEGRASLQKNKINNQLVEEVYLHYKDREDTLFSSAGKMTLNTFLQKEIPNTKRALQEITQQFDVKAPHLWTTREDLLDKSNAKFFYIVPLQNSDGIIYGSAIYTIKESRLISLLGLTNGDEASTNYIINNQNQILASTEVNELSSFLSNEKNIPDFKEESSFEFQNQKYLIETLENRNLDISFVSVTNPSKALSQINQMQSRFISIFLAIFFFGMAAVVFLGKQAYRPLRKIDDLVKQYENQNGKVGKGENVHQTIASFLVENQELHEEIKRQTPHAREQVLRKLLGGRFKCENELMLLLQSVHIKFSQENYFVMTIDTKLPLVDDTIFLMDYVEEVRSTTVGYNAYATEILSTEVIALVVSYKNNTQNKVVGDILSILTKKIGTTPKVGVGGRVTQLTNVHASYIEALTALDYCTPKEGLVYYSALSLTNDGSTLNYPEVERLKLIQSLNQGNLEMASETIKVLLKQGVAEQQSLSAQKMYGFYLLNTLAKTGDDLIGTVALQKAEEYANFTNLFELETNLLKLAEKICCKVQAKPQNQESQLRERLFQYIQKEFTSSQLSLETIAEEFSLSVSYLSRFIKQESGMTFSKYIQGLRLEKVKESLVSTERPIKEIIRDCGYYDVSNYTRKFRTIVGVTPGQYRSLNRQESSKTETTL